MYTVPVHKGRTMHVYLCRLASEVDETEERLSHGGLFLAGVAGRCREPRRPKDVETLRALRPDGYGIRYLHQTPRRLCDGSTVGPAQRLHARALPF